MGTSLGQNFDATQVEPATDRDPVPTGWYNVMITDGDVKENKAKTGGFAELTLKIMDGKYSGSLGWDRLNLWNQNPVAVEIAQRTLSAICHAVGVFQVADLQQLFGKPLMAKFQYVPEDEEQGYSAKNDIKGYAKTGERKTNVEEGGAPTPTAGTGTGPAAPQFQPPAKTQETPAQQPAAPWAQGGQPAASGPQATAPAQTDPPPPPEAPPTPSTDPPWKQK